MEPKCKFPHVSIRKNVLVITLGNSLGNKEQRCPSSIFCFRYHNKNVIPDLIVLQNLYLKSIKATFIVLHPIGWNK